MTRNAEANIMLRMLLNKLKADPAAIDWSHYNRLLQQRQGRVSLDGITLVISSPYASATDWRGVERRLRQDVEVLLVTARARSTAPERRVLLRQDSPLLSWRIERAVRASFDRFADQMARKAESASQKAISAALNKRRLSPQENRSKNLPQAGQGLQ